MSTAPIPGSSLAAGVGGSPLFAAWCTGGGDGPAATAELASCLSAGPADGASPFFRAAGLTAWAAAFAADLPDDESRARAARNLAALTAGNAQVVITGHQPGFLGGPLFTLYKIAAAVALARRLSATGSPAVPVFWSGDDDDDLVEALEPAAWRSDDALVRSEARAAARRGRLARRRVGNLAAAEGQAAGLAWLAGTPHRATGPAACWAAAAACGDTWARLQRRALLEVFRGTDLIVVSGDDPLLHQAAEPLYVRLLAARESLGRAAEQRGAELASAGWHAQLSARSLARPLFVAAGDGRRVLGPGETVNADALRPGVLLRSPIQDWLFDPRAVVVGPGEYSYLRQLTTVYGLLGVARAPLVPRLFGWLLPGSFDPALLQRHAARAQGVAVDGAAVATWSEGTAASLARMLAEAGGIAPERARALAEGRLRRWRRGVDAMLRHEARERMLQSVPRSPAWIFPEGLRQERLLAWGAVLAMWGAPLVDSILRAADLHLESGVRGDWREWLLTVTPPEDLR